LFGTCEDFLDGVYQYPGGWIGDRYGRRRALRLFVALAMIGYGLYWLAPSWPFVFAGLLFVMAWSSMASPPLFAVVGDALPRDRRALGFTVQSILKRVPIAVAPTLGGLVIAAYGVRDGVHLGLGVTVVLAPDFPGLVVAFVVGGVREVGEPARKALIVDLVQPTMRARSVGLYYLVRSLAIAPAAFIGGLLWGVTPALPFWVAGAIG